MKKIIFYISCLLLIGSYTHAVVLDFTDNTDFKLQKIVTHNKLIQNSDSLAIFFINQGYLDVSITQISDTLKITTFERYNLQNIYIDSIQHFQELLPLNFTKQNVTSILEKIMQIEQENGYQFASIKIESTVVNDQSVDLFCSLNKGPQVALDTIIFEGLTKTKHSLLNRYFMFDDSIISPQLLRSIELSAKSIPFVQFVPPSRQEINQGYTSANLILPFKERENLLFEGGGGYLSEQDLFIWNISLIFQNIIGGGREISIVSQKKDIKHQQLKLQYEQPMFLFGIGSANMAVQTRDYRDLFYEFVFNVGMQTYYKKQINFGVSGELKSVEQENNNLSYNSKKLSVSISNKELFNFKNNSQYIGYNWKLSYGNRKYKNDSSSVISSHRSFNESRIDINTQLFSRIKNPLICMIDLNLQSYQTDESLPPFAELYLVGGSGSIRGFKDEQFISIRNFTFTLEPQYQFESGNLFMFYDGGVIYNRITSELSEFDESTIFRYGYGGGIAFTNDVHSLKISFGWNKNLSYDNPRISLLLKTQL